MATCSAPLDWVRDGRDWPNRDASGFVEAAHLSWHVQVSGQGPTLLLLHGTGASTHSWRRLLPLLAERYTVVVPDLPGHGFTSHLPSDRLSLSGMAKAVAAMMAALGLSPDIIVGHSAGAAIAIRMAIDGHASPRAIISLNGALFPFRSLVGPVFESLAKIMALNPVVPRVFAWRARSNRVIDRLLVGTGSKIDDQGAALYARLARNPGHVAGAIGMMAGWDLRALEDDLPRLAVPLTLVVGGEDAMVPPDRAFDVKARVPGSKVIYLRGLGHLAHEEAPDRIRKVIETCILEAGSPEIGGREGPTVASTAPKAVSHA